MRAKRQSANAIAKCFYSRPKIQLMKFLENCNNIIFDTYISDILAIIIEILVFYCGLEIPSVDWWASHPVLPKCIPWSWWMHHFEFKIYILTYAFQWQICARWVNTIAAPQTCNTRVPKNWSLSPSGEMPLCTMRVAILILYALNIASAWRLVKWLACWAIKIANAVCVCAPSLSDHAKSTQCSAI